MSTADTEQRILAALDTGRLPLADLEQKALPADGFRPYFTAALINLARNGQIRYPFCLSRHAHDDFCQVEVIR